MLQAWNSSVRACALLARDLPSVDAFPKDERPDSFVTISVRFGLPHAQKRTLIAPAAALTSHRSCILRQETYTSAHMVCTRYEQPHAQSPVRFRCSTQKLAVPASPRRGRMRRTRSSPSAASSTRCDTCTCIHSTQDYICIVIVLNLHKRLSIRFIRIGGIFFQQSGTSHCRCPRTARSTSTSTTATSSPLRRSARLASP